jgi:hypothetical protein
MTDDKLMMHSFDPGLDSPFTPAERWESIKAGLLSGLSFLMSAAVLLGLQFGWVALVGASQWLGELGPWADLLLKGAIALITGGLFGLTYRYAVRTDTNAQLSMGVILAFSLVRILAVVEVGLSEGVSWSEIALWSGETLIQFAIAVQVLSWAMARGWVRRFPSPYVQARD